MGMATGPTARSAAGRHSVCIGGTVRVAAHRVVLNVLAVDIEPALLVCHPFFRIPIPITFRLAELSEKVMFFSIINDRQSLRSRINVLTIESGGSQP